MIEKICFCTWGVVLSQGAEDNFLGGRSRNRNEHKCTGAYKGPSSVGSEFERGTLSAMESEIDRQVHTCTWDTVSELLRK